MQKIDSFDHESSKVPYSTVQYSTVQYSTVQYSTVRYSTVLYCTVQCSSTYFLEVKRSISRESLRPREGVSDVMVTAAIAAVTALGSTNARDFVLRGGWK